MAQNRREHLFEPSKIEWLLSGGLEGMEAGERELLLVMAETKLQDGYTPNAQENAIIAKLRDLAGQDYDAQDIQRKVEAMVTSPKKADQSGIILPATINKLLQRVRKRKAGSADDD